MWGSPVETGTLFVVNTPTMALQEKPTASCPAPAAGQPPVQPFELLSTHVSAAVRQKAEAEASGLFNAFSVTHCSPFLETRPVPHSPCRNQAPCHCSSFSASAVLRAEKALPQSSTNGPPKDFTLILAASAAARFAHILQNAEHPEKQMPSGNEKRGEPPKPVLGSCPVTPSPCLLLVAPGSPH